jgi:hypothetical protein
VTRSEQETETIRLMLGIYCKAHHGGRKQLCEACQGLLAYTRARAARCPHGENKPTCRLCQIHCFKPDKREQIQAVMRYAGPRMLLHHPVHAMAHLARERKSRNPDQDETGDAGEK